MWFLNCRTAPVGGPVGPVRVTDGSLTYLDFSAFQQQVQGRDLVVGVHGFNVHQAGAIDHLQQWSRLLTLGPGVVFVGGLWPGDSAWLGALEYAFAARTAMESGDAFAAFLNAYCTGVRSLSFVSHSLGARVVLRTIGQLIAAFAVRRLVLMAPAVDDTSLTGEFKSAAQRVGEISVLGSRQDDVLRDAFPLGNPVSGIFARGHPYWHAALGREGPSAWPTPNNVGADWLLPDGWRVGHSDYLPPASPFTGGYAPAAFTTPVLFPARGDSTYGAIPAGYRVNGSPANWQCGWTAGWTSLRVS